MLGLGALSLLLMASDCELFPNAADSGRPSIPQVGPGLIRVRTATTGVDTDPDGYTATVDSDSQHTSDTITAGFSDVPNGNQTVALHGIAPNCRAIDENPRQIVIDPLAIVWVIFHVDCVVAEGDVVFETSTSGDSTDPDGYQVTMDGDTRRMGDDDSIQVLGVSAGEHTALLHGLDWPCRVVGEASRPIRIEHRQSWNEAFDIDCSAVTASVAGVWDLAIDNTRVVGALCDLEAGISTIEILQDGESLSVHGLGGPDDPWSGSVTGRVVTFGGTRADDTRFDDEGGAVGGVTHASFTMLVDPGGATMSGTEQWTWVVAGEEVCTDGLSSVNGIQTGD